MESEITLEAGAQAFGDGSHPTTAGVMAALKAIDAAEFSPRIACDMGAGSGILSFALYEKFRCPVMAVDLLAASVATLRENAIRNGCAEVVTAVQADGFSHPYVAEAAPFDLIVMNILAEPLVGLAGDAYEHLSEEGVLILSGILIAQEERIVEAYALLGLERTLRIVIGDWVTLVWQKPEMTN